MFLLVSGRHVGAHTDGHQHGVSIQISINLGKILFRISCIRKVAVIRILARDFSYLPSFISQILDFIYWTVLIFILIYFEWRDTENQQYPTRHCKSSCPGPLEAEDSEKYHNHPWRYDEYRRALYMGVNPEKSPCAFFECYFTNNV